MGGRTLESGPPPLTHCVSCHKCLPALVASHLQHEVSRPKGWGIPNGGGDAADELPLPTPVSAVCSLHVQRNRHGLPLSSQQAVLQVSNSNLLGEQTEAWT